MQFQCLSKFVWACTCTVYTICVRERSINQGNTGNDTSVQDADILFISEEKKVKFESKRFQFFKEQL